MRGERAATLEHTAQSRPDHHNNHPADPQCISVHSRAPCSWRSTSSPVGSIKRANTSSPFKPVWQTRGKMNNPVNYPINVELLKPHFGKSACIIVSTTEANEECKGIIKWDYDEGKTWLCLQRDLTSPHPHPACWGRNKQGDQAGLRPRGEYWTQRV